MIRPLSDLVPIAIEFDPAARAVTSFAFGFPFLAPLAASYAGAGGTAMLDAARDTLRIALSVPLALPTGRVESQSSLVRLMADDVELFFFAEITKPIESGILRLLVEAQLDGPLLPGAPLPDVLSTAVAFDLTDQDNEEIISLEIGTLGGTLAPIPAPPALALLLGAVALLGLARRRAAA